MLEPDAALEVEDISKAFRIPIQRPETLRERILTGITPTYEELRVLEDVTFSVRLGELFGIAGRNGSGKTTLLKIIAGIYRADRGEVRAAGRLAPILELGVGFNPELPAWDNVLMNTVLLGLEPGEARARYPNIVRYAGLEPYQSLKLKNYSSGMRARLGFAITLHVDADLFLFDEVLAVGDKNFREKSEAAFGRIRAEKKTGILVTHSMGNLIKHCDRALLLEDGRVRKIGEPEEVAEEYAQLEERAGANA